jgi:hypothetical protein
MKSEILEKIHYPLLPLIILAFIIPIMSFAETKESSNDT